MKIENEIKELQNRVNYAFGWMGKYEQEIKDLRHDIKVFRELQVRIEQQQDDIEDEISDLHKDLDLVDQRLDKLEGKPEKEGYIEQGAKEYKKYILDKQKTFAEMVMEKIEAESMLPIMTAPHSTIIKNIITEELDKIKPEWFENFRYADKNGVCNLRQDFMDAIK